MDTSANSLAKLDCCTLECNSIVVAVTRAAATGGLGVDRRQHPASWAPVALRMVITLFDCASRTLMQLLLSGQGIGWRRIFVPACARVRHGQGERRVTGTLPQERLSIHRQETLV